jgi:cytochrome c oxidase subunit 3
MADHELEPELIYSDPRQRDHALHLGMWVFLGSETLLFAGLFGLYAAYRSEFSVDFRGAVAHNNALIGTINTLVLIVSSFFVAWAVHAMRHDRPRTVLRCLGLAMVLGVTFLVVKSFEYADHISEGIKPGIHYASHELATPGAQTFFTLYYAMTGLHALHVIAGITILGWLAWRVKRGRTFVGRVTELELGGLYWHLVDIMWIFLWPLLYLTR